MKLGLLYLPILFGTLLHSSLAQSSRRNPTIRSGGANNNEVFFVNLEEGYFGCQVNRVADLYPPMGRIRPLIVLGGGGDFYTIFAKFREKKVPLFAQ